MTGPQRIQRRRTKGWRMPEGAVYVGRPSRWGNPFRAGGFTFLTGPKAGRDFTAADAVQAFRNSLAPSKSPGQQARIDEVLTKLRAELRDRDLVCWCPLDQPCHADVLLELANGENR